MKEVLIVDDDASIRAALEVGFRRSGWNTRATPLPGYGSQAMRLRSVVAPALAEVYPQFAATVFGVAA